MLQSYVAVNALHAVLSVSVDVVVGNRQVDIIICLQCTHDTPTAVAYDCKVVVLLPVPASGPVCDCTTNICPTEAARN